MNLQVDLILPSEQRSANPMGLKLIGKILLLVSACVVGGYVGLKVMAITDLQSQVRGLEARWAQISPRQKQAATLIKEATQNAGILEELEGWRATRLSWNKHLRGLALAVPPQVQLQSLSVQHEFLSPKSESTVRSYTIAINGRCARTSAESAVQSFQQNIRQTPPLAELVEDVEVPLFGEDPKKRTDRVFQLTCTYKPMKML